MALGQGSRLLESINEPIVRDPDHNMNQDELENLATVQRSERTADQAHLMECFRNRLNLFHKSIW